MPVSAEDVLPIIDLGPFTVNNYQGATKEQVLKQLRHGCETLGCFYLKNHGIDRQLIKDTISDLRYFYSQPHDYKLRFVDPEGSNTTGYLAYEQQNVNAFMGRNGLPGDPIESYLLAPHKSDLATIGDHFWPDQPPTFKSNISRYYNSIKDLSEILMHILSEALNAPGYEDFFYLNCTKADHRLRTNYFPPDSKMKLMQNDRLAAHTDASAFTVVLTDQCTGNLHVFNEATGDWVRVMPKEGMFIMNFGDAVARWTNDCWKSSLHKVTWPETQGETGRMSVVFTGAINMDSVLESIPAFIKHGEEPKYEKIIYEDYLKKKMKLLAKPY